MPDVARSRADNIANFPNNTTGQNSAQDQRDLIESVFGCSGELRIAAGNTAQGSIGTSFVQVTGWNSNGGAAAADITVDHTTDDMTITVDGVYLILCSLSVKDPTASALFRFEVHLDDVATGQAMEIVTNATPDRFHLSCFGLLLCAVGDVIDLKVKSDGAGRTFTPTEGQLIAKMIG